MDSRSLSFLPLLVLLTVSILTCTRAEGDVDSVNVDVNQICDNGEVNSQWEFICLSFWCGFLAPALIIV